MRQIQDARLCIISRSSRKNFGSSEGFKMSRVAKMLADYVLCKGVIIKDEYDLYEYGFQIALETGLSLIISGIIASMLHMIPEGIPVSYTHLTLPTILRV